MRCFSRRRWPGRAIHGDAARAARRPPRRRHRRRRFARALSAGICVDRRALASSARRSPILRCRRSCRACSPRSSRCSFTDAWSACSAPHAARHFVALTPAMTADLRNSGPRRMALGRRLGGHRADLARRLYRQRRSAAGAAREGARGRRIGRRLSLRSRPISVPVPPRLGVTNDCERREMVSIVRLRLTDVKRATALVLLCVAAAWLLPVIGRAQETAGPAETALKALLANPAVVKALDQIKADDADARRAARARRDRLAAVQGATPRRVLPAAVSRARPRRCGDRRGRQRDRVARGRRPRPELAVVSHLDSGFPKARTST